MNERCNNPVCMKNFQVHAHGENVPGGKDLEPIICPYCSKVVRTEMTPYAFSTSKIDDLALHKGANSYDVKQTRK